MGASETDNAKKARAMVGAADPVLVHKEAGPGWQSDYEDGAVEAGEPEKFSANGAMPKAPDKMPFAGLKGGRSE